MTTIFVIAKRVWTQQCSSLDDVLVDKRSSRDRKIKINEKSGEDIISHRDCTAQTQHTVAVYFEKGDDFLFLFRMSVMEKNATC